MVDPRTRLMDPLERRRSLRSKRTQQRQQQGVSYTPEEEATILRSLVQRGAGAIGGIGSLLDLPGSMVRDVASTFTGTPRNPLDQLMSPFSMENRITGRDLNRQWGLSGKEDTWGNFAGGIGTEILLDPLTYVGAGWTRGGQAAKASGLLDDVAKMGAKKLGTQAKDVGKRWASRNYTPRDLIEFADDAAKADGVLPEVTALQRFEHAAGGAEEAAKHLDEPLKGRWSFAGNVFGKGAPADSKVLSLMEKAFGEGSISGSKTMTLMDKAIDKARFGNPVARELFSKFDTGNPSGATTEHAQRMMPELNRAENAAIAKVGMEVADIFSDVHKTELFDEQAIRKLIDPTGTMTAEESVIAINKTINKRANEAWEYAEDIRPNLSPEMEPFREPLTRMKKLFEESHASENAAGLGTRKLGDTFIGYIARLRKRFPGDKSKGATSSSRDVTATFGMQDGREPFLMNLRGGTAVIQEMSVDPLISGYAYREAASTGIDTATLYERASMKAVDPSALGAPSLNKAEVKAIRDIMEKKYGKRLQMQMPDGVLINKTEDELDDLARWIGSLDPRHADLQMPAFEQNMFTSMSVRLEHGTKATQTMLQTYKILAGGIVARETLGPGRGKSVYEVLQGVLGIKEGKITPEAVAQQVRHLENGGKGPQEALSLAREGVATESAKAQTEAWRGAEATRETIKDKLEWEEARALSDLNTVANKAQITSKLAGVYRAMPPKLNKAQTARFDDLVVELSNGRVNPADINEAMGVIRQYEEFAKIIDKASVANKRKKAMSKWYESNLKPFKEMIEDVNLGKFDKAKISSAIENIKRAHQKIGSETARLLKNADPEKLAKDMQAAFQRGNERIARAVIKTERDAIKKKIGPREFSEDIVDELNFSATEAISRIANATDVAAMDVRGAVSQVTDAWKGATERTTANIKDVVEGMKPDKVANLVDDADVLKNIFIPEEIAADVLRVGNKMMNPHEAEGMRKWVGAFLGAWKSSVTLPWPDFHVRNQVSGLIQNWMGGAFEAKSVYQTARLLGGKKSVGLASEVPLFKGLTDDQAYKELQKLAVAHGVYDPKQGLHYVEGTAKPIAGLPGDVPLFRSPPEGTTRLQRANPLKTDTFAMYRIGGDFARGSEGLTRVSGFLALLKKGWSPEKAAERIKLLQVDYTAKAAADPTLALLFPFFKFVRGTVPATINELLTKPGGKMAQTIRTMNRAQSRDATTPQHVAETVSMPVEGTPLESLIGNAPEGTKRYLTGAGLMFENAIQLMNPNPKDVGLELISNSNPLLKGGLELLTGKSFFMRSIAGGRDLDSMDPPLSRLQSNIQKHLTGEEQDRLNPSRTSRTIQAALQNSPLSKLITTATRLTDTRKGIIAKGMQTLTGAKIADISPAAQDAMLQELVDDYRKEVGGRDFTKTFIPEEIKQQMSPGKLAKTVAIDAIEKMIQQRKKRRKALWSK